MRLLLFHYASSSTDLEGEEAILTDMIILNKVHEWKHVLFMLFVPTLLRHKKNNSSAF